MSIEILYNPAVLGAIIGALVGALASAIYALIISEYKFNKQKKGVKALLKSEINNIITNLKEFDEKYLKAEINDIDVNRELLMDFYYMMSNFPIWNKTNWINLLDFIPSIFKEEEINKINQFYTNCEEVTDVANSLAKKEPYNKVVIKNYQAWHNKESSERYREEFEVPKDLEYINADRNIFKQKLSELIEIGKEIEKIFK